MATASFQPPANQSKNFLNSEEAPPATYLHHKSASTSSFPMASELPPWNKKIRITLPERYGTDVSTLRPARQPMYLPAAIRPSEQATARNIPSRPRAPDTPPTSEGNSYDDNAQAHFGGAVVPLNAQLDSQSGLHGAYGNIFPSEGLVDNQDEIQGLPTDAHWKPDATTKSCAICRSTFTWFFRRHHCRRCGHIVCYNHSQAKVPLDHNARFHKDGHPSKACDRCYEEWILVKKLRASRASSIAETLSSTSTPTPAVSIPPAQRAKILEEQRAYSMARSEGGYHWSTF